jgi:predicted negative regulator of RcsB-dependent stress response
MTSPNPSFKTVTQDPESILDWFQLYSKQAAWAAVGIVVLGAGGWFYMRSRDLKAERAEKAYYQAIRAVPAGNLPLAESDLRKMIQRYDGTPSAAQARLQLAQILYDQGKYQQGVDELRAAEDKVEKTDRYASGVHLVLAAGLEQLRKFSDAAAQYEKAAKTARFDSDRQRFLSMAAGAYLAAGNKAKAKEIWTDLGADSKGVVAGEARVRLGELTAAPAPQS